MYIEIEIKRLASLISICYPSLISIPRSYAWVYWHLSKVDEFILNDNCFGDMGRVGFR